MSNSSEASELSEPTCTEKWAVTTVKVVRFKYTWTIHNFSFSNEKTGEKLVSPSFNDGSNKDDEWVLHLYPNGNNEKCNESLSIYLCLQKSTKTEILAKFNIDLLDETRKKKISRVPTNIDKFIPGGTLGWADYAKKDYVIDATNKLLTNDRLTILCEINAIGDTVAISGDKISPIVSSPNYRLSDDFGRLLKTQKFADVTMKVNDVDYRAHGAIMAARSAIFARMLEVRKAEKILDLDITSHKVMREMLNYIYTGKTGDIKDISKDLLKAANKYELKRLKIICENSIAKSLTVNNAVDTLIFAEDHKATRLKEKTVEFINTHANDVKDTPAFAKMFVSHPQLIAAIALDRLLAMKKDGDSKDISLTEIEEKTAKLRE